MKPDQLTVIQNNNIEQKDLIRYSIRIIYYLMSSSYCPDRFGNTWQIKKRKKSDNFLLLNAEQLVNCIKVGLTEQIPMELADLILETAFNCGLVERSIQPETGTKSYCMRKPDKPFRP